MRAPFGPGLQLTIELDGAPEPLAPGATVRGVVRCDRATSVRALAVRLAFVERTRDYAEVARTAGDVVLARGELAAGRAFPFSIVLPGDALPSFDAEPHGRVGWELRAWADVLGRDPDCVRPLRVEPGGTPAGRWTTTPEAPGGP